MLAGTVTGNEVHAIRTELGLSASQFADLVGGSSASVWRWEATKDGPARIDSFPRKIVWILQDILADRDPQYRKRFATMLQRKMERGDWRGSIVHVLEAHRVCMALRTNAGAHAEDLRP